MKETLTVMGPEILAEVTDANTTTLVGGGVAGGALAVALAWIAKEFLPFIRQRKKDDMEAREKEEARIIAPYVQQIERLEEQVKRLDAEISTLRTEHVDCVKNYAALEARFETKMELMQSEISGLRQWRHDQANKEHVDVLKAAIEAKQQT